jgi:hypothetical protein
MPVTVTKKDDGKYKVTTPEGVKAKGTTKTKAEKLKRLLNAIKHGWKPKDKKAEMSLLRYQHLFVNEEEAPVAPEAPAVQLGKHNNMKDIEFDPRELAMGMREEKEEHNATDELAKAIVKDHLVSDPAYYSHLAKMKEWVKRQRAQKKK